jgi:tight adherence protein B
VTGAAVGLLAGLSALLLLAATSARAPRRRKRRRFAEACVRAGLPAGAHRRVVVAAACCALFVFLAVGSVSGSPAIAVAFAVFGGYAPVGLVERRARLRTAERRDLWPDVVDNLASAVRAGLSLPEAVTQLAERGPAALRPDFAAFGRDYAASGRFGECLDRLKDRLADPVADRIVEALRLAREVGGSDLGRLLRNLSQFLRDDARTRAELVTRQGWTVNAARLALAAPWAVLALLSLRPETVAAYDSAEGVVVLAVGGAVSAVAYRLMVRIGRLPDDERVLR